MATQYVDRCYLEIDGVIVECEEIGYKLTREGKDTVKPMTPRNRATGHSGGVVSAELTAVVSTPRDGHVVDFEQYLLDETLFSAFIHLRGGKIKSFYDCQIKDIDNPGKQGETLKTTLSIDALDFAFD